MPPLPQARRMVRRWGQMWRVMRDMHDSKGARFAKERATLWREQINRRTRRKVLTH